MSLQLQIAIPLFACTVLLVVIAILRKYIRPEVFVICLALASAGTVSLLVPIDPFGAQASIKVVEISQSDIASLAIAQQYMLEGCYNEASEVLDDIQKSNADNADVLLAKARCTLLLANYGNAERLYASIDSAPAEEVKLVKSLSESVASDSYGAIAYHLDEKGSDPEKYGFVKSEQSKVVSYDEAASAVIKEIKAYMKDFEKEYGKDMLRAVEATVWVNRAFDTFLYDGYYGDTEGMKDKLGELKKLVGDNAEIVSNPHIRAAILRGYTVIGEYKAIAEMADSNAGAEEMIVLSELYLREYVDEDDFPEEFSQSDTAVRELVLDACENTLEKNKDKLSEEDYALYEECVDELRESIETPVLSTIKENLYNEAQNGSAVLASKCYLALAKIEQSRGKEDKTSSYISDALNSAQDSDDENYRVPMSQMLGVVEGNVQSSEIKNIANYVDSALDNSMPLDIRFEDIPSDYYDDQYDYDDDDYDDGDDDDDDDRDDKKDDKKSSKPDYNPNVFKEDMTEIVSQSTATMNISAINKDGFPDIKARVQIDSAKWSTFKQIEENLKVYDCGSEITEFKLEKLEYQNSRIILLCDISGSMSGDISTLKEAVVAFADKMVEGEKVAVVGFDDEIVFIEEFSSSPTKVKEAAVRLDEGGGGTALYDSLVECLGLMQADVNGNNIIIAMTDGQDGNNVGEGEMYQTINSLCARNAVTVYTIGVGDGVNTDYLEHMAVSGNGSFLYVNSADGLESFYDFIHGMLYNQYILSYTAKNQTRNERKLEISMNEEMGHAEKTYYLVDPVYTDEGKDSYNPYTVEDVDLFVNGLTTKFLYKSSKAQEIDLKGQGFDKGDDISVRLIGNVRYTLSAEFVDENTYKITVPAEVSVGVYDLSVSVGGNNYELKSELSIAAYGTEKTLNFGSYTFTALSSYVNDNNDTVLSGNVMMNGWLHFNGDVVISGNYSNAGSVSVTDNYGAYISYSRSTANGLAKFMAEKGIPLNFGKLGTFKIYSDKYDPSEYKDFPVDDIGIATVLNMSLIAVKDLSISVYPDMIMVQGPNFNLNLPFQKQLLKDLDFADLLNTKQDLQILIGATSIALDEEFKFSSEDGVEFTMVSLPLRLSEVEIKANTMENDYSLSGGVKFKAIKSMDELKLGFEVKKGRFDSLMLQTGGTNVTLITTPVPISIGDFGIELSGFSEYDSDNSTLSNILGTTVTALFKVDCASLEAVVPKVAEILDAEDAALATLDNCKLSLKLKDFRISFDADVKLFTILNIGKCSVSLGCFDYTNALIGYYNEDEVGIRVAYTQGIDWETGNIKMQLQGTSEIVLGMPYSGLWYNGVADFEVGWWIFKVDFDVQGDALAGIYKNSSGNMQFSVILRGTNSKGEYSGFHVYLTKATGLGMYRY